VLILSDDEVARLLDPAELRAAMEKALTELSAGRVIQPVRNALRIPRRNGWFGLMPAVYEDVIGAKLVTVFPENIKRGIHTHNAVIQLFRAETGEPLAVLGGRVITALRTAAVSALATRELSDPGARILAILGSGVQARTHYQALRSVRNFEETRVWSRTPRHAQQLAEEIGARAMSAEEAVKGADVIVTVTNSSEPVLYGAWLKAGAYVNAVGAVGPRSSEIDDVAMTKAAVIVESREPPYRSRARSSNLALRFTANWARYWPERSRSRKAESRFTNRLEWRSRMSRQPSWSTKKGREGCPLPTS
jgi:ornithine cyclodeaminase/alanine dehydrogenase-like protein (mu-crystallin family)